MQDPIKELYETAKKTGLFVDENDFRQQLNKSPKDVYGAVEDQGLFVDYSDFENILGVKKKLSGVSESSNGTLPLSWNVKEDPYGINLWGKSEPTTTEATAFKVATKPSELNQPLAKESTAPSKYFEEKEPIAGSVESYLQDKRKKASTNLENELYFNTSVVENHLNDLKASLRAGARELPTSDATSVAAMNRFHEREEPISTSADEVTDYLGKLQKNPDAQRQYYNLVATKKPEKAPQIQHDIYVLDAMARRDEVLSVNPEAKDKADKIFDNASKIEKGEYVYDVNGGRLLKPVGFGTTFASGMKERFKQMEDYDFYSSAPREQIIEKLNKKLTSDPDDAVEVPDGKIAEFGQMLGMESIAMLKSSGAALVADFVTKNPWAGKAAGAAAVAPEYYARGYAQGLEQAYGELKRQGMSDEEAYALAKRQAEVDGDLSAAEGAVGGAIQARLGKRIGQFSNVYKTAVGNILTKGKELAVETAIGVSGDAATAGVLQYYKNVLANDIGIERDVYDQVPEQMQGEFMFGVGAMSLTAAGHVALSRDTRAILNGLSKTPKDEADARIDSYVQNKLITPEQGKEVKRRIDQAREENKAIPSEVSDENRLIIQDKIDERKALEKRLETEDKAFHPEIKEGIKAINQQIVELSKGETISQAPAELPKTLAQETIDELEPKFPQELVEETTETTPKKVGDTYTTKTGNQTVELKDGELVVTNNKTGTQVTDKTKKKAILEYIDEHDFTQGETAPKPDFPLASEEEAKRYAIENTKNPYELAEIYVSEEQTTSTNLDTKQKIIAEEGVGYVNKESYDRFGDPNNRRGDKDAKAKEFNYFRKDGTDIDEVARELSDKYGMEITPQDIVQFIDEHPRGEASALKLSDSDIALSAVDKFKELTGIDLDRQVAEKIINKGFDELSKVEQDLAQQYYETAEQLEQDHWDAFQRANPITEEDATGQVPQAGKGEAQAASEGEEQSGEQPGEQSDDGNEYARDFSKKSRRKSESERSTRAFTDNTPRQSSSDNTLKPVDFPELLQLARMIAGGKLPKLKNIANALGYFSPRLKKIVLNRVLFNRENYEDLVKVLAHELGHFIDFLPDETMNKGNILGRIASIKDYMEKYLPLKEGAEGILTKEDIARLREEAKKDSTREVEIDEEIEKVYGITPEDVLAIWNSIDAGKNNPKLLEFIQGLSDAEKKKIVVQAMKGNVPESVKQFGRVEKVKTGNKIKVTITEDEKAALERKINEEVKKRQLWVEKEIYDEAFALSKKWRPMSDNPSSSELKYRRNSKEIYADMISILFNSPGTLEQEAPKFFKAFNNYLEKKPEFKKAYEALMSDLNDPNKIAEARLERIKEGFRKGEEKRSDLYNADKDATFFDNIKEGYHNFYRNIITLYEPLLNKLPNLKGPEMSVQEKMRDLLEQMGMWQSRTVYMLDAYKNGVVDPLEKAGIDMEDFGALVLVTRNMSEARADVANPFGLQTDEANQGIVNTINQKYTLEQQKSIQEALLNFYDTNFKAVEFAYENGLVTEEMFDTAKENKYNYATFKPISYIDEKIQSASFLGIKGTLQEVTNPVMESMLKALVIERAALKNKAARAAVTNLNGYFQDGIYAPKLDEFGEPTEKPPTNFAELRFKEKGKTKTVFIDEHIAEIFNSELPEKFDLLMNVASFFGNVFKAPITQYNIGFALISNPIKDIKRTQRNVFTILSMKKALSWYEYVPLVNLGEFAGYVLSPKTGKSTRKLLAKTPDEVGNRMIESAAINPASALFEGYNDKYSGIMNLTMQYDFTKKHLGLQDENRTLRKKIVDALTYIPRKTYGKLVMGVGKHLEYRTKVAAFRMMEKRLGAEQAAYYTRNFTGTPNFAEKTATKYGWVPFAKVIVQGLRNDTNLATNPQTAAAWWYNMSMYTILPGVLTAMAYNGYFDDEDEEKGRKLSDNFKKLTKYTRLNKFIIPAGIDDKGKAKAYVIPQDDIENLFYQMPVILFGDNPQKGHDALMAIYGKTPVGNIGEQFTTYKAWWDYYANDINPYDAYFKKSIIRERQFKAGGVYALGDLAYWTAGRFGVKYPYRDESNKTFADKLMAISPLRRLYTETNYGETEKVNEILQGMDKEKAAESIEADKVINKKINERLEKSGQKELDVRGEKVVPLAREVYKEVYGKDYSSELGEEAKDDYATIKRKITLLAKRANSKDSVAAMAILNAKTKDGKKAVLEYFKNSLPKEEYTQLVQFLDRNNIYKP